MIQYRYLYFVLVVGLLAGCNGEAANSGDISILVFSKTDGYRHQSIPSAIQALQQLAAAYNVEIDTTEDATTFNLKNLSTYDAVVFLLTTGDVLNDDQQHAFTKFIRAGGGFVGIHSASDTEHEWPWYGKLVGGFFNGHPFNPNVREGTVLVANASHPSTRMLPGTWVRTDEWYDFRNLQDGITILLNVDETSYKRSEENPALEPRPIAWFHEFDGGRSFYTALGHTEASYRDSLFLEHIWGGLRAVLGEKGEYLKRGRTQYAEQITSFQCESVGSIDIRFLGPETVELSTGRRVTVLQRLRSASGAQYEGKNIRFWNKGGEALFSLEGQEYRCLKE